MRRRLWWFLCQFDSKISDDCGLESHIPPAMDTKLLSTSTTQISTAGSVRDLTPKTHFTEMTVSLVKIEMAQITLRLKRSR